MKKSTAGDRSSDAKRNLVAMTVDEYLAGVPEPARGTLQKIRAAIKSVAP